MFKKGLTSVYCLFVPPQRASTLKPYNAPPAISSTAQDEIAISLGADPSYAASIAATLLHNPNGASSSLSPALPPPPKHGGGGDPPPPPPPSDVPKPKSEGKAGGDRPTKKARAVKPPVPCRINGCGEV